VSNGDNPGSSASTQTSTNVVAANVVAANVVTMGDASTGKVTFPLKASTSGRYLVDQNSVPFRIQGDAAWSFITNLTPGEMDTYLADRKSRGFNTLLVSLLEHKFAVQAPRNRAGDFPFNAHANGSYDFSTPSPAYFAFADAALDKAAAAGMLVLLDVMYLGANGAEEGWWAELNNANNTPAKSYAYGQFIGKRWKDRGNIAWVFSGDYTPPAGSEGETRLLQIYKGVRDAGATQLAGAHVFDKLSSDWPAFVPHLQINAVYASGPDIYKFARTAFGRPNPVPVFLLESGYEQEKWFPGDPASIRSYLWWAQLSAVGGVFYGHRDIWAFNTDSWSTGYPFGSQRWQRSLDTPGSQAVKHMADLLRSLAWYDLVPSGLSGMKNLITDGGGTMGGADYVTAAASTDGKTLVAYLPPGGAANRSITVDMSAMSGPTTARWWDPTSGAFTAIASNLGNTGRHAFAVTGNNAAGAHDWVLVLSAS